MTGSSWPLTRTIPVWSVATVRCRRSRAFSSYRSALSGATTDSRCRDSTSAAPGSNLPGVLGQQTVDLVPPLPHQPAPAAGSAPTGRRRRAHATPHPRPAPHPARGRCRCRGRSASRSSRPPPPAAGETRHRALSRFTVRAPCSPRASGVSRDTDSRSSAPRSASNRPPSEVVGDQRLRPARPPTATRSSSLQEPASTTSSSSAPARPGPGAPTPCSTVLRRHTPRLGATTDNRCPATNSCGQTPTVRSEVEPCGRSLEVHDRRPTRQRVTSGSTSNGPSNTVTNVQPAPSAGHVVHRRARREVAPPTHADPHAVDVERALEHHDGVRRRVPVPPLDQAGRVAHQPVLRSRARVLVQQAHAHGAVVDLRLRRLGPEREEVTHHQRLADLSDPRLGRGHGVQSGRSG